MSQTVREMETELGKNESEKCKYKQYRLGELQQKHCWSVYHSALLDCVPQLCQLSLCQLLPLGPHVVYR